MRPIFIVGYMGAGKSTLGRKLAQELGLTFVDTDIFLENRFRRRVSDMFAEIGEEAFRRRERIIAEELSGMQDAIIATGGGLPCFYGNMDLLNESGLTIYLEASVACLGRRLELCKRTRPSIRDKSGEELLHHIAIAMDERAPVYARAHLTVSIEHVTTDDMERTLACELAERIRRML